LKASGLAELRELFQELGAKHPAKSYDGKQELGSRRSPIFTVESQRSGGNHSVNMKVWTQLLIPSVQYHRESHLAAEVVLAEIEQRLRCGMEQQIQQQSLILLAKENQCVELVR